MANPRTFSFSIKKGDPVRLATAFQGIVSALAPLTDDEARDVVRELGPMYAAPPTKATPCFEHKGCAGALTCQRKKKVRRG